MKNIGKPCALIAHARFDEGEQAKACSLLYPVMLVVIPAHAGIQVLERFLDARLRGHDANLTAWARPCCPQEKASRRRLLSDIRRNALRLLRPTRANLTAWARPCCPQEKASRRRLLSDIRRNALRLLRPTRAGQQPGSVCCVYIVSGPVSIRI
jgi:hypothetical protein